MDLIEAVKGPAGLTALAGGLLTALMLLIAPLNKAFASLDTDWQVAVRAVMILLTSIALAVGSCYGWLSVMECSREILMNFFTQVVLSAVLGLKVSDAVLEVGRQFVRLTSKNMASRAIHAGVARRLWS